MKQKTVIRQAIEKIKVLKLFRAANNTPSTTALDQAIVLLESLEPVNEQQIKNAYYNGYCEHLEGLGSDSNAYYNETFEKQ